MSTEQSKTPLTDAARDYTSPEKMDRLCQSLELAANALADALRRKRLIHDDFRQFDQGSAPKEFLKWMNEVSQIDNAADSALAEFEKLKL